MMNSIDTTANQLGASTSGIQLLRKLAEQISTDEERYEPGTVDAIRAATAVLCSKGISRSKAPDGEITLSMSRSDAGTLAEICISRAEAVCASATDDVLTQDAEEEGESLRRLFVLFEPHFEMPDFPYEIADVD